MFGLGAGEIILILFLALIFVGPKKIPELAKGLGKGIREFQKAKNELLDEVHREDFNNATPPSSQQRVAQNPTSQVIETSATVKNVVEEGAPHQGHNVHTL